MSHKLAFKHKVFSYAPLSEDDWEQISASLTCQTLKKNEVLIAEGEVCDTVWFVAKGLIRFFQQDEELNERTTCFACENHFATPFSSYLRGVPSHEILIALEPTDIIAIKKADFIEFMDRMPAINRMYRQVLEEAFLMMETLNYYLQHHNALTRYQKLILEDAPELLQRVPLTYLASYLGISPETLSRVRAKI